MNETHVEIPTSSKLQILPVNESSYENEFDLLGNELTDERITLVWHEDDCFDKEAKGTLEMANSRKND